MKKAIALALSLILVLAVLPFTVSARNLNDDEKAIFAELRVPTEVADGGFVLPEDTIKQGENYLAALDYELTKEQTQQILAYVADAKAAVKEAGTGVTSKWTKETKDRILNDVDLASKVVNLRARANTSGAIGAIEIYDPATGEVEVKQDHLVKTTGSEMQMFAIVGICGLVALCACVFVSKKVELF